MNRIQVLVEEYHKRYCEIEELKRRYDNSYRMEELREEQDKIMEETYCFMKGNNYTNLRVETRICTYELLLFGETLLFDLVLT